MRKLLLLYIAILLSLSVRGQEMVPIEGEIFLGYGDVFRDSYEMTSATSFDVGAEIRYNLPRLPIGVGVQYVYYEGARFNDLPLQVIYGGNFIGPVVEYSVPRGRKVQFIASLGGGLKFGGEFPERKYAYCRPKVAVEFKNHFRIYFASIFTGNYASGWSVGISGVIGGGPKKTKNK